MLSITILVLHKPFHLLRFYVIIYLVWYFPSKLTHIFMKVKMAEQVKRLVAKGDDLNLVPRNHKVERRKQTSKCILWHTDTHRHTYMCTLNK